MRNDEQKNKGALAIILHEIHNERNKNIEKWTDHQEKYFLRVYSLDKILIIGKSIQDYFEYNDIDLSLIHPGMYSTVEEREKFLKFILNGFIQSGFMDRK